MLTFFSYIIVKIQAQRANSPRIEKIIKLSQKCPSNNHPIAMPIIVVKRDNNIVFICLDSFSRSIEDDLTLSRIPLAPANRFQILIITKYNKPYLCNLYYQKQMQKRLCYFSLKNKSRIEKNSATDTVMAVAWLISDKVSHKHSEEIMELFIFLDFFLTPPFFRVVYYIIHICYRHSF